MADHAAAYPVSGMHGADISVVVSSAKGISQLRATLESVTAQKLAPLEVIVVHGEAAQHPLLPAGRHGLPPQVLHVAKGNGPQLRNAGLAAARGHLVAFCDGGDLWKPGYLAAMAEMWRVEPGLRLAYGDVVPMRDGTWKAERRFSQAPAGFWEGQRSLGPLMSVFDQPIVPRLLGFQPFQPSALVAERRFLCAAGGWSAAPDQPAGDYATALRLVGHKPLGIMHRALVGVREDDVTPASLQAMHLNRAWVLEQALASSAPLQPCAAAVQASICRHRRAALDIAFASGDFHAVQEIAALLPKNRRPPPTRLKLGLARWPAPLRWAGSAALLGLASFRVMPRKPG
jgi:hypothetical protein